MTEFLDMSDDELDAILADTKVTEEGDLDDTPIEVPEKTEDEEEADPKEDDSEEEETEEESDEDEDEDGEEEEEDEDKEEDEDEEFADLSPASRQSMERVLQRIEETETRNEKLQADLDRANMLRDRAAGKAGALKQKLEKGDSDADPDEFDDEDDSDKKPSKNSEVDDALAEIRAEKVDRAIGAASRDFYEANMEFFSTLATQVSPEANQEFQADLVAKVREAQAELGEDLLTMTPKMAAKVSDTLLRSAFADMKLTLIQDLKKAAANESNKSRDDIRARKKGAAGTRSNKRPAAKAPTSKSVQQMTDKELDAALAAAANLLD